MKLIVAVSGGIDSVVMLHRLTQRYQAGEHELVVAHVDHGYREDSAADARFVEALAQQYGHRFTSTRLELPDTSEATAREQRWRFLRDTAQKYDAAKIATAHHRDDVYETMLLNIIRGTGRHGLTSLQETEEVMRPLLTWTKRDVYSYALGHTLEWVEDPTNAEDYYARNQLRRSGVLQSGRVRAELETIYTKLIRINAELDSVLEAMTTTFVTWDDTSKCRVDRSLYNQLPYRVQLEVARYVLLRLNEQPPRDSLQIERAALGLKTARPQTETILGDESRIIHNKQWSRFTVD